MNRITGAGFIKLAMIAVIILLAFKVYEYFKEELNNDSKDQHEEKNPPKTSSSRENKSLPPKKKAVKSKVGTAQLLKNMEEVLGLPKSKAGNPTACEIIKHQAYELCYVEKYEQAAWVMYTLTSGMIKGRAERENNFSPDPDTLISSATPEDYRATGYDRGHLAPAADFKFDEGAMSESFYMSNMSPQIPALNRGIWERVESKVRKWAEAKDTLYVITGPIINEKAKRIGKKIKVAVPDKYFKIILTYDQGIPRAIGFLIDNDSLNIGKKFLSASKIKELTTRSPKSDSVKKELTKIKLTSANSKKIAVSVDSIETITNLDFFPRLQDDAFESIVDHEWWFSIPDKKSTDRRKRN